MQQTEKYQLNLIEKTDAFSPDALNQNMEKVEAQFDAARAEAAAGDAAVTAAFQAADSALDGRVQFLEAKRVVAGTYHGDGNSTQFIGLGFTPLAVMGMQGTRTPRIAWKGNTIGTEPNVALKVVEGGFQVGGISGFTLNDSAWEYFFVAFA